jgi:hypothetical protein
VPNSTKVFNFSGSGPIGDFQLMDNDGAGPPPSEMEFSVPPGTYVVSEAAPQDPRLRLAPAATWTLNGIVCSKPNFPVAGRQVSITVGPGELVSCKFRNVREDEPDPPDPPAPPEPPPPRPPPPPLPPPEPPPPPGHRSRRHRPRLRRPPSSES